jgi:phosphotransferase system  glucose/maltose/N-acetylglucosamine-specific IIC component
MAMRETVGSLRAYLVLSGLLATVAYGIPLTVGVSGIAAVILVGGVAVGLSYVFLGVRLKSLLANSPTTVFRILYAGVAFLVIALLVQVAWGNAIKALPSALLGLLITWYMLANTKRLSAEMSVGAGASPTN